VVEQEQRAKAGYHITTYSDLTFPRNLAYAIDAWSREGGQIHPATVPAAVILREIINPWIPAEPLCGGCGGHPKVTSPCGACWRRKEHCPTVYGLIAATIEDFSVAPVLADALEDNGCRNTALLVHLRGPNNHCPGCWALDSLMGTTIEPYLSQR
jgi:hypothetical protein